MNFTYSVEVVDRQTKEVVHSLEAIGANRAQKLSDGLKINLNADKYFVLIVKQD